MSDDGANSSLFAKLAICLIFSALGFMIAQGPSISIDSFFTPLHHDDFYALYNKAGFHIRLARPVSSNLIINLGSIGRGFYYSLFFTIWMVNISLTSLFVFRFLKVQASLSLCAVTAAAASIGWFSLQASWATVQYLGLMTNALSYLFGMSAALLLISRSPDQTSHSKPIVTFAGFFLLVLLAAFSKEDMAVFLGFVILWCGYQLWRKHGTNPHVIRDTVILLSLVASAYILSIVHSIIVGSPFVSGRGPYEMSSPLRNILTNARLYFDTSNGTRAIIGCAVAAILVTAALGLLNILNRNLVVSGIGLFFCFISLSIPYLLLPRYFDYYMVNFIPFLIASVPPLAYCMSQRANEPTKAPPTIIAMAVGTILACGLWVADRTARGHSLEWNRIMREGSLRQFEELRRAQAFGLESCGRVIVSGVDGVLGPFIATSSDHIRRSIGLNVSWVIAAKPNTLAGQFGKSITTADPQWRYIVQDTPAINLKTSADCSLMFDSKLYATLSK